MRKHSDLAQILKEWAYGQSCICLSRCDTKWLSQLEFCTFKIDFGSIVPQTLDADKKWRGEQHSLMVTVAHLESGIFKDPGFTPASVHLVFFVLSASETGLLLVVKLGRTIVMMRAGVKTMHQSNTW